MKFSWKALILAPLPVPLVYSVAFVILSPMSKHPISGFLFCFILGSVFSYGTTLFLFLPCLFLISRLTPLTARLTCLLGALLGGLALLPVDWVMWTTSGVDSGPPPDSFGAYFLRQGFDPIDWAFLVGGLVTAMLYWFLANQQLPGERPSALNQ
jgi:RsiW-degrading membrane proteinase PrsW (M82 family)